MSQLPHTAGMFYDLGLPQSLGNLLNAACDNLARRLSVKIKADKENIVFVIKIQQAIAKSFRC